MVYFKIFIGFLLALCFFILPLHSFSQEKISYPRGVYEGQMRKSYRHGQGVFIWTDSTKYEGQWRYDLMHGHGKISWPNGAYYSGGWREGRKNGHGTFVWPNGDTYTGNWKTGKQSGKGELKYADGTVYEGTFKDGKIEGRGVKIWPNGQRYEGEFRRGKMHGEGFIAGADMEARIGKWKDDVFVPCDCSLTSLPVGQALENADAVFIGVVSDILPTENSYLAKMEILKHWKGKWISNRNIFLKGGYSSCDFVYAKDQIYLVYATERDDADYNGVFEAKRCSRTTLLKNVINDLRVLDELAPCETDPSGMLSPAHTDPVCGCDGNTYKNAYQAHRNGINVWEIGDCKDNE